MPKLTSLRRRQIIEKDPNYKYRVGDRMLKSIYVDGSTGEFIEKEDLEQWTKVKAYSEIIENEYGHRIIQPYVFCVKRQATQISLDF